MDQTKAGKADVALERRQSLEATRHYACKKCGAPGTYVSHPSVRSGWPGCFVAITDPRSNRPVGDKCPNCGAVRPKDTHLGEIWSKEWRRQLPPLAKLGLNIHQATTQLVALLRRTKTNG